MAQNYEYFGKYILLEKLAMGGMAEVWLARAPGAGGIGKFIAIKKILPQFSDNQEFIQMFKDEAAIAVNLTHSNIVSIYEFGIENNMLFLVMDYVEGRNLRQILNKLKNSTTNFSHDQIIYMIKEIAAGLDHAHRSLNSATGKPLNITHRDMSPQNIMISFEGEVKIVDFGIAKAENQIENTKTGTLKGKFGYMSPEQADGQETDLRTDIFSLGIVMWELLANDRLFIANNEVNTLKKIKECQIPSLTKINPNINPELERIVMKALARDRSFRYQTAAIMHRDLSRFLARQYPDFSPHDFAVFIKTLYTDEILEIRKRLIEYAKIPLRPQTTRSDENDKTLVTSFPQANELRTKTGQTGKNIVSPNTQPTLTKTETFSEEISQSQNSVSGIRLTPDSLKPKEASGPHSGSFANSFSKEISINSNPSFPSQINLKKGVATPVLDAEALRPVLENKIDVKAVAPSSIETDLELEDGGRSRSRGRKPRRMSRQMSSNLQILLFVATLIGGYFVVATYFPKELQIAEDIVRKILGGKDREITPVRPPRYEFGEWKPKEPAPMPKDPRIELASKPPAMTKLTINSQPAGAEIYINGISTGQITPGNILVPAEQEFTILLKKDSYIDYTKEKQTTAMTGASFTAVLQKAMVSYVDLDVRPPKQVIIYVNDKVLNENIPITKYAIPANVPVTLKAVDKISGAEARETITLKEDQRKSIILRMPTSTSKKNQNQPNE